MLPVFLMLNVAVIRNAGKLAVTTGLPAAGIVTIAMNLALKPEHAMFPAVRTAPVSLKPMRKKKAVPDAILTDRPAVLPVAGTGAVAKISPMNVMSPGRKPVHVPAMFAEAAVVRQRAEPRINPAQGIQTGKPAVPVAGAGAHATVSRIPVMNPAQNQEPAIPVPVDRASLKQKISPVRELLMGKIVAQPITAVGHPAEVSAIPVMKPAQNQEPQPHTRAVTVPANLTPPLKTKAAPEIPMAKTAVQPITAVGHPAEVSAIPAMKQAQNQEPQPHIRAVTVPANLTPPLKTKAVPEIPMGKAAVLQITEAGHHVPAFPQPVMKPAQSREPQPHTRAVTALANLTPAQKPKTAQETLTGKAVLPQITEAGHHVRASLQPVMNQAQNREPQPHTRAATVPVIQTQAPIRKAVPVTPMVSPAPVPITAVGVPVVHSAAIATRPAPNNVPLPTTVVRIAVVVNKSIRRIKIVPEIPTAIAVHHQPAEPVITAVAQHLLRPSSLKSAPIPTLPAMHLTPITPMKRHYKLARPPVGCPGYWSISA